MIKYIFYFLAFLSILSALMVVTSRNPIHSVLYLILTMFTIAGHYIVLNAQFLFAVHLIVYAGAVMVLFLFTIMFLNLNADTEPNKSTLIKFAAVLASGILFVTLLGAFKTFSYQIIGCDCGIESVFTNKVGFVQNLGKVLFKDFLLPFELSSILFLSAIVGAVFLGKKEVGE